MECGSAASTAGVATLSSAMPTAQLGARAVAVAAAALAARKVSTARMAPNTLTRVATSGWTAAGREAQWRCSAAPASAASISPSDRSVVFAPGADHDGLVVIRVEDTADGGTMLVFGTEDGAVVAKKNVPAAVDLAAAAPEPAVQSPEADGGSPPDETPSAPNCTDELEPRSDSEMLPVSLAAEAEVSAIENTEGTGAVAMEDSEVEPMDAENTERRWIFAKEVEIHEAMEEAKSVVNEMAEGKRLSDDKRGRDGTGMQLYSAASMLPHPAKARRGGEDAYFIADDGVAIGVADGVGGWAERGIDAGLYARELMVNAEEAMQQCGHDVSAALVQAHRQTRAVGSSTACLITLQDGELKAANLGDSGFLVVRNGTVIFRTPAQQHAFNFPYQIGSHEGDRPEVADLYSVKVEAGDVVVAGTDGLFDNVFDEEIRSIIGDASRSGARPDAAAQRIAALARVHAADRQFMSPFAEQAVQAGYQFSGGKMDDITVVVAYVEHKAVVSADEVKREDTI
eukprot:jgi/Chlat1/3200/Chrsp22S08806